MVGRLRGKSKHIGKLLVGEVIDAGESASGKPFRNCLHATHSHPLDPRVCPR